MITSLDNLYELMNKCKQHDDQGHWRSKNPIMAGDNEGFIYSIHCKNNGMLYIGKKTFSRAGKKTKKVDGKTVKNKEYGKDSGWRNYCSSSENVKNDILTLGKEQFDFYHLHTCRTKGCLTYSECNILHVVHALTSKFDDGSRVFYNNQIGAIKFVPVTIQQTFASEHKNNKGFHTYATYSS